MKVQAVIIQKLKEKCNTQIPLIEYFGHTSGAEGLALIQIEIDCESLSPIIGGQEGCAFYFQKYQMWSFPTAVLSDYHSIPGKHPLPGKRSCTTFQGATVAASIQVYGSLIPGKPPCGPKLRVMLKRPWALTRDSTV